MRDRRSAVRRRARARAECVVVGAACLVASIAWWGPKLGPMRSGGHVSFFNYDHFEYVLPALTYGARALRRGTVPLWNPYQLCGTPYLAAQQHGILYPPHWLAVLLPVPDALRVLWFVHYAIAMGGAYWCARVFGVGRAASVIAGVGYAFSGTLWAKGAVGMESLLVSAVWMPWLLGLTRAVLVADRSPARAVVALGAVAALVVLGGHPFHVLAAAELCGGYAAVHLLAVAWRGDGRPALALVSRLALAAVVAFGLSAVQLLPNADLAVRSPRHPGALATPGGDRPFPSEASVGPATLARDVVYPTPAAFGLARSAHPGTAIVALALVPLLWPGMRRRALFLVAAAGASFVLALGDGTPVYGVYRHLPGAALFRQPQEWLVVAVLCLAVLGAMGADALARRRRAPVSLAMAVATVAVSCAALWVAGARAPADRAAMATLAWHAGVLVVAGALLALPGRRWGAHARAATLVVVAAATAAELYSGATHVPSLPVNRPDALEPPDAAVRFVRERGGFARTLAVAPPWNPRAMRDTPPKLGMLAEIETVSDYEDLFDGRYAELLGRIAHDDPGDSRRLGHGLFLGTGQGFLRLPAIGPEEARLLRVLGVRFVIARRDASGIADGLPRVHVDDGYEVHELPRPVPRAYVARRVRRVAGEAEALAATTSAPAFVLARGAIVEPAGVDAPPGAGHVAVERHEPHAVDLAARLTRRGLVVLEDQYDPYWTATVDGGAVPVLRTNAVFRGVVVEAGRHVVGFRYRPKPFYVGAALTLATLAALAIAPPLMRRRRRRQPAERSPTSR